MDVYMGLIFPSAIPFNPYGTLLCQGQSLSVNQNQAMYAIIGNIFGGTASNFNLPDLRSRVPVGAGQGTNLTNYVFGSQGIKGVEQVTLTASNIAQHNHAAQSTITGLNVSMSTITATASGSLSVNATAGSTNVPGGTAGYPAVIPDLSGGGITDNNFYGGADNTNSMPVSVNVDIVQPTFGASGGSVGTIVQPNGPAVTVPFNIVQPVLPLNYLIIMLGIYPTRS